MPILINLNCNNPIIFRQIHWLETFSFSPSMPKPIFKRQWRLRRMDWKRIQRHKKVHWPRGQYTMEYTFSDDNIAKYFRHVTFFRPMTWQYYSQKIIIFIVPYRVTFYIGFNTIKLDLYTCIILRLWNMK